MNFHLRVNLKTLESGRSKPPARQRDLQFRYIRGQIRAYSAQGFPVISVDTKSRELLGPFHKAGRKWSHEPIKVLDHDFPSDSNGVAIPYGIYDLCRNEGFVCVGTACDTSEFAVDAIRTWWTKAGSVHYPTADRFLVLADCGGSNGYRRRLWKYKLHDVLCNRFGLQVKVCHYPPGCSKWNPIEHRMFSFISRNWSAQPLYDYETVLKFIRTTKTSAGLKIRAVLNKKKYQKGVKVSDAQMAQIALRRYTLRPDWNYSISPSRM
jgi:hypothetical protein